MEAERTVAVDVTPRMYVEHGGLHGALQEAVYRELEDDPGLQEFFDLRRPNRFIPEDADTEMWEDTEDAVYTGSDPRDGTTMRGRYAMVQVISCRDKDGYAYDKPAQQLAHFERWPENRFDAAEMDGGSTGWYVAAADLDPDDVPTVNAALGEAAADYAERLRDDLMEADDGGMVHGLGLLPLAGQPRAFLPALEDRYEDVCGDPEPPARTVPVTLHALERRDLEEIDRAISAAFRSLFVEDADGGDR